ncbi:MAG: TRAP transporter small permease [Fretibacterium sp.]|nr:TRAP transporter small permease [Fretibacterium sp.]
MTFLKKLDRAVALILKAAATSCCVGIAVILFVRVIIRFTPLNLNLSWTDEVVAWLMAWMIFLGAALIARERGHFCVDLLPLKLEGTRTGALLDILITLLGVVFFATFLKYSLDLTRGAVTFSLSPILKVSDRVPYASMPVSCALILIYLARDLFAEIRRLF